MRGDVVRTEPARGPGGAERGGGDPTVLGTLHVPAKPCKVLLGNEGRPLIRDKE